MFYSPFIMDKSYFDLLCFVLITQQVHKVVELKRTYQIIKWGILWFQARRVIWVCN